MSTSAEIQQQQQFLTQRSMAEEKAKTSLKRYNIQPGSTIVQKKRAQPIISGANQIVTNIYPMSMQNKAVISRYHVKIVACNVIDSLIRDGLTLTTSIGNDYKQSKRRLDCKTVMDSLVSARPDLFQGITYFYDLQSILFSTIPIRNIDPRAETLIEFGGVHVNGYSHFKITLKGAPAVTIGEMLKTTDNTSMSKELEQFLNIASSQAAFEDTNIVTYSASRGYMYDPRHYGFSPEETPTYQDTRSTLAIGYNKTVHAVEGGPGLEKFPTGAANCFGSMGMVIECKKTPFHNEENLLAKATAIIGPNKNINALEGVDILNKTLTGLSVRAIHIGTRTKVFIIDKIINATAATHSFNCESLGGMVTLVEYYQRKHQIALSYPNAPLVQANEFFAGRRQENLYPMELCVVCDNQRVNTGQMTGLMNREMIKHCAVPPDTLMTQISNVKHSLGFNRTRHLQDIQVSVSDHPLTANAKFLQPPGILFGQNEQAIVNQLNFSWDGNRKFFRSVKIQNWGVFVFNDLRKHGQQKITTNDLMNFTKKFCQALTNSGLEVGNPTLQVFDDAGTERLRSFMIEKVKGNLDFVLVAHPDGADDMHHMLKYCELVATGAVTQGILFSTVLNVVQQGHMQTLQNIVNKTNVKLGGLNYVVLPPMVDARVKALIEHGTLFIGFGINHPTGLVPRNGEQQNQGGNNNGSERSGSPGNNGQSGGARNGGNNGAPPRNGRNGNGNGNTSVHSDETINGQLPPPTVIGFSANTMKDPLAFNGGFCYQTRRQEADVEIVVGPTVAFCLAKYAKAHDGNFPQRIFIYRHGPSEGMFQFILKFEIPMILYAIQNITGQNIPLTYLVANKLQPIRLFNKSIRATDKHPEKNVKPGTVVDSGITHPCMTEFFLCAHRTLQGTARVPCYTNLVDQNDLTVEELENITNILCYGHQIVNSPTSLPTPVFVGEEYAKRGRNLYNSYMEDISKATNGNGNGSNGAFFGQVKNYEDLTEILGHQTNGWLGWRRVNA